MKLRTIIWFILFLFTVILNSSFAQRYYEVSFEIFGGGNYSYYSETQSANLWGPYEGTGGFNIGGGYTYRVTHLWALHIEFIYSNKTIQSSTYDDYITQKLNYLDIPLILQFNISPNSNFNSLLNFGPYISYLITNDYESPYPEIDNIFAPNNFDFGLLLGIGLGFPIESYEVGIDLRYHLGFGDMSDYVFESGGSTITSNSVGRLNSLVILLKFSFNFNQIND